MDASVRKLRGQTVFPFYPSSEYGKEFLDEFIVNGWIFVEMPKEITHHIDNLTKELSGFFCSSNGEKQKMKGPFGFGYSNVPHKEGVRFFTGNLIKRFTDTKIYPEKWTTLLDLSRQLDDLILSFISRMSLFVLHQVPANVAKKADIPVAFVGNFGMVDVAHYFNNKTMDTQPLLGKDTEEVNCVPHYDPGLLSLSFLSTEEGLQLFDERSQSWVDGPVNTKDDEKNIGVIWLGYAATQVDQKLRPGIHRVIYPKKSSPRLTAWYEVCTVTQASVPDEQYLKEMSVNVPNLIGSDPISLDANQTLEGFLGKIERVKGIPRTKVKRPADTFKSWTDSKEGEKKERESKDFLKELLEKLSMKTTHDETN